MARDEALQPSRLAASSLTIAALIVAAGFLGSRLLGLLRSVIIAHSFGTSPELDAYWVAFRLPDLVFQLLAGATLASAFIPTFAGVLARRGEEAAWRLASSVLNLVLLGTAAFAAVSFLLAPLIVPLLAPGLGEGTGREAELRDLAVRLTRIMLLSPLFFAVSGMFMGILNARKHFLTSALAPMLYNLGIIVAALLSRDVEVLAAGVVAGAVLHLAVQLPDLRAAGMVYRLVADWKDAAVREVGALMAPRILGLAAIQVHFYFIAVYFASGLGSGAISAVSFSWLIVMMPVGVIGISLATAAFPTMAEQAARRDDELAATLSRTLRLILFLSLPGGAALTLLAKPVVVVLLQRGAFDLQSTELTVQALRFYGFALFAQTGIEILSRGFYALSDTRTPVLIAVGGMLTNLILTSLLVGPLELRGLALALSLASILEFAVLYRLLAKRVPRLATAQSLTSIGLMVLATGLMAAVAGFFMVLLEQVGGLDPGRFGDALALLLLTGGIAALVYFATTLWLGCEEPRLLLARLPALAFRINARP